MRPRLYCLFLAIISLSASPLLLAQNVQLPPYPLSGWTHIDHDYYSGQSVPGLPVNGAAITYSSTVIAEIDGNPGNGPELAVGGADGVLYVYRNNGEKLWSVKLPSARCRSKDKTGRLFSSPAVGEIFGDGIPYVVIGYGGFSPAGCDGGVAAFRGPDGARAWNFSTKRYAKKQRFWAAIHGVFSSPALGDVDHDGKLEVGFGSLDRNVYMLNADGSVRWYYMAADTVRSSPAFVNLDSDPDLEMLIGTDISKNRQLRPPTPNGGYLYALKTTQRSPPRIAFREAEAIVWQVTFDQVIFSSPVVADVVSDNPGAEVIIGSGCFFPQDSRAKTGAWFKVLRLSDGKLLRTLATPTCQPSSAAVGDIDDDGQLEVVVTANGSTKIGGDGNSRIMAWKADGPTLLWSVVPKGNGRNDAFGGHFMSPVIADLDGNGSLEVVAANAATINILNGNTGEALTCQSQTCDDIPLLLSSEKFSYATPAIADLDSDGQPEIVIGAASANPRGGAIYVWTGFSALLSSPPGQQAPFSAPWPMARGNPAHTGVLE